MTDIKLLLGSWLFEFSDWWLMAAAALLLLALPVTLVASWRRLFARHRLRAVVVVMLNLLAFFALLLLLLSPKREHMTSQNIILLSEGTNLTDHPGSTETRVYIAPGSLQDPSERQAVANANWLLDIGQLPLREPALEGIELRGFGLSEAQWQAIPDDVLVSFKTPPIIGFSDMRWPQTLVMGETLVLQGTYSAPQPADIIELRLLDPTGVLSTAKRLKSGDSFSMMVRPKSPGNLLYRLQAWRQDNLLSDQPVTVSVSTGHAQQILIHQSAPSFETRQLKDFAALIGARVLLNTRISKAKFVTQFVNQTVVADATISPASLAASDWLIIDGRALTELAEMQQQWLLEAVQAGLGVLVLADESLLNDFASLPASLVQDFSLLADTQSDDDAIVQLMNVAGIQNELPLPVAHMKLAAANPAQRPLDTIIADAAGRPLVASQSVGTGKVAIALINQSYRWLTAGHRTSWSNYWAALSTALSRNRQTAFLTAPADNEFYAVNQRARVCAFAQQSDLTVHITTNSQSADHNKNSGDAMAQTLVLPLTADKLGSLLKCGWFWPPSPGWQHLQLRSQDDSLVIDSQSRYVWADVEWQGQKRFSRSRATLDRLARAVEPVAQSDNNKLVTETLNPFWIWLLFVFSASALWLERKLDWDAPQNR